MTGIDIDKLKIATPCQASWAEMTGDERIRFCADCSRNVYNVASLTRDETASLIRETEGRVCLRLYQRRDGTVITADCPVGRRRRWMVAAATTAVATAAAAGIGWLLQDGGEVIEPMMGDIAPVPYPHSGTLSPDKDDPAVPHPPEDRDLEVRMGTIAPHPRTLSEGWTDEDAH